MAPAPEEKNHSLPFSLLQQVFVRNLSDSICCPFLLILKFLFCRETHGRKVHPEFHFHPSAVDVPLYQGYSMMDPFLGLLTIFFGEYLLESKQQNLHPLGLLHTLSAALTQSLPIH